LSYFFTDQSFSFYAKCQIGFQLPQSNSMCAMISIQ
jgi:hypothetical protein